MQIYVQDLFDINFSSSMCDDTVSTYDTSTLSLIFNCTATLAICMHEMHDTTYDTLTVGSLRANFQFGSAV
jgi:hypothetical protein